jgi:hypothetical protein
MSNLVKWLDLAESASAAEVKANSNPEKGGLHGSPPHKSFNFAASDHVPFSSYCTVSVTVVELDSGANTPVTVMV